MEYWFEEMLIENNYSIANNNWTSIKSGNHFEFDTLKVHMLHIYLTLESGIDFVLNCNLKKIFICELLGAEQIHQTMRDTGKSTDHRGLNSVPMTENHCMSFISYLKS